MSPDLDNDALVIALRESAKELTGTECAQLMALAASRLVECLDHNDNMERGMASERLALKTYEAALSKALDEQNRLTEKLCAAEDRANNAQQAADSWESAFNHISEEYHQLTGRKHHRK